MKARVVRIRRQICAQCVHPCEPYQMGRIDHADPAAACPVKVWPALEGSAVVPEEERLFPRAPAVSDPRWRLIHEGCLKDALTLELLDAIVQGLPSCCRTPAVAWIERHPLPTVGQFAWSVDFHNDVNARTGRRLLSEAEARSIWAPFDSPDRDDASGRSG